MFDGKRHLLDSFLWAGAAFTHPPVSDTWQLKLSPNKKQKKQQFKSIQFLTGFLRILSPAQHSPYVHDADKVRTFRLCEPTKGLPKRPCLKVSLIFESSQLFSPSKDFVNLLEFSVWRVHELVLKLTAVAPVWMWRLAVGREVIHRGGGRRRRPTAHSLDLHRKLTHSHQWTWEQGSHFPVHYGLST